MTRRICSLLVRWPMFGLLRTKKRDPTARRKQTSVRFFVLRDLISTQICVHLGVRGHAADVHYVLALFAWPTCLCPTLPALQFPISLPRSRHARHATYRRPPDEPHPHFAATGVGKAKEERTPEESAVLAEETSKQNGQRKTAKAREVAAKKKQVAKESAASAAATPTAVTGPAPMDIISALVTMSTTTGMTAAQGLVAALAVATTTTGVVSSAASHSHWPPISAVSHSVYRQPGGDPPTPRFLDSPLDSSPEVATSTPSVPRE